MEEHACASWLSLVCIKYLALNDCGEQQRGMTEWLSKLLKCRFPTRSSNSKNYKYKRKHSAYCMTKQGLEQELNSYLAKVEKLWKDGGFVDWTAHSVAQQLSAGVPKYGCAMRAIIPISTGTCLKAFKCRSSTTRYV